MRRESNLRRRSLRPWTKRWITSHQNVRTKAAIALWKEKASIAAPIARAKLTKLWPSVNVIIPAADTSSKGAQMHYILKEPRLPDPDPEPTYPPPGPDPDELDWNIDDPVTPPLNPLHA